MVEASITRYYTLEDKEYSAPSYYPRNDYKNHQSTKTPIVIDNGTIENKIKLIVKLHSNTYNLGSSHCRAGWSSDNEPACMFNMQYIRVYVNINICIVIFDNVVSKYRDRRLNQSVLAVGMDALADPAAKSNARSPFDNNVVCDFEKMV